MAKKTVPMHGSTPSFWRPRGICACHAAARKRRIRLPCAAWQDEAAQAGAAGAGKRSGRSAKMPGLVRRCLRRYLTSPPAICRSWNGEPNGLRGRCSRCFRSSAARASRPCFEGRFERQWPSPHRRL